MATPLRIAIDGNEANVTNRVGSNVYAFELLHAIEKLVRAGGYEVTVLLSSPAARDLPKPTQWWKYEVIAPKKFWTQWALPLFLLKHRSSFDVLFTPGHYAPRLSAIPYVSAVMDTAFLEYPAQFTTHDRVQLRNWTQYSVKRAKAVVAISEFTKASVIANYRVSPDKVQVIYPAVRDLPDSLTLQQKQQFFKEHKITEPYILFVGTLQPRKNIETIIDGFEQFARKVASSNLKQKNSSIRNIQHGLPKLVLAGKIGWLAENILKRITESPFKSRIILPGFISDQEKKALYQSALCTALLGIHEGFGIPPLEAMKYGSVPVVANATSLPEVVGKVGYIVDPFNAKELGSTFFEILTLSKKQRAILLKEGREQASQFSWEFSAKRTLELLSKVHQDHNH